MDYGRPIVIGDNVMIGSNAYIAPGVTIGNNAKIGAIVWWLKMSQIMQHVL